MVFYVATGGCTRAVTGQKAFLVCSVVTRMRVKLIICKSQVKNLWRVFIMIFISVIDWVLFKKRRDND